MRNIIAIVGMGGLCGAGALLDYGGHGWLASAVALCSLILLLAVADRS